MPRIGGPVDSTRTIDSVLSPVIGRSVLVFDGFKVRVSPYWSRLDAAEFSREVLAGVLRLYRRPRERLSPMLRCELKRRGKSIDKGALSTGRFAQIMPVFASIVVHVVLMSVP